MSILLPTLRTNYGADIGIELFFAFPNISDNEKTYLSSDIAAGVTVLPVASGVNYAANQYLLLGQAGNETSELVQISSVTSTTITLVSATVFAHNRGDIAIFIPYNEIVAEFSTDNGATFTAISAVPIRADSTETYMQRPSDLGTYLYRFRFFNSTTSNYSQYSDTVAGSGYADNTIYAVKHRALDQLGEVINDLITDKFLNDSIQEARRMADYNPEVFRWSFRQKFGLVVGQLFAGQWSVPVPATLRDPNTYKNILSIRIGRQNRPLVYQERVRFNQNYLNVGHATVIALAAIGATSIQMTSTHDFDNAGSISIGTNVLGGGVLAISYTGNNKATNTLTGVTGVTTALPVGADVWQQGNFGLPMAYTIDNGKIYLDVPLNNVYDGQDVHMDFYGIIPPISSDNQTFDEPFYDMYVAWLRWKIKYIKANGKIDRDGDVDYKEWNTGLGELIGQETPGQVVNFFPDINGYYGIPG